MKRLVLRPKPLLHQLEHVAPLQLRVVLRDGLIQLVEEALAAVAAYTWLAVVLAARSGSADQLFGGEHGSPSAFRGYTRDPLSR